MAYIYLSSIADNFVSDPVYDPASLANTSSGKQGGCLKFEPAVDGKVTLYYSSGFNNRSVFVWDMTSTLNEGMGAQILANNIEQGAEKGDQMKADGVKDKVHTPTFDVVGGHTYYIFGSNAQQELYQMTWTSFLKDTYNGSTGIEDATVNVNTKVNENRIYTIDGRYAGTQKSSLVKGLYIMNGKKVVVK